MPIGYVGGGIRRMLCTYLNDIAYRVVGHHSNEVVYAGYRIVVISGHKHDDSLSDMSS